MPLPLIKRLETTTCKTILERIKARAVKKFGEKWIAGIVREYVAIAQEQGDTSATTLSRRPHIERAFSNGSCNADTLIMLAGSVGCKFQIVCTVEEVENL